MKKSEKQVTMRELLDQYGGSGYIYSGGALYYVDLDSEDEDAEGSSVKDHLATLMYPLSSVEDDELREDLWDKIEAVCDKRPELSECWVSDIQRDGKEPYRILY